MKHRIEVRQMFDEPFKRMVIEEYLSTGSTKVAILRKYNIRFKGALQQWMKKLGYSDMSLVVKRKLETLTIPDLPKKINSTKNEDLLKKIQQLERQLEDEKLRSEAFARIIEKAEKELNIPIRKKPNTR